MTIAETIRVGLKQVIDPELGINMIDLGLLYDVIVQTETDSITVVMTLTTPGCPLGGYFLERVTEVTAQAAGVDPDHVEVKIVFDPPWTQDMMSDEAHAELGFD